LLLSAICGLGILAVAGCTPRYADRDASYATHDYREQWYESNHQRALIPMGPPAWEDRD